jgi:nitrate/TMAO reductase-like tetraheme cytochrome c subunit
LRPKKNDWIFILVVGAVIGTLVVLSLRGKEYKPVSLGVAEHAGMTRESTRESCLACHAPEVGGRAAIDPAKHPTKWKDEKWSCTRCHAVEGTSTASILKRHEEERQRQ